MTKDPKQGSAFSEGGGRPFPMEERKPPAKTAAERGVPLALSLDEDDLNKPGKGPVNYAPRRGRKMDSLVKPGAGDAEVDDD